MSNRITTILGTPTQVDVILGGGTREGAKKAAATRKLNNPGWSKLLALHGGNEGNAYIHHGFINNVNAGQEHQRAFNNAAENEGMGGPRPDVSQQRENAARTISRHHHIQLDPHNLIGGKDKVMKASTTRNDDTITATAADYIVTARFATSHEILNASSPEASKPWKQGEDTKFMYMPDGIHTIYAGFRKKTIGLTVKVVKDEDAQVCASSFNRLTAAAPKQKPFGCIEHEEKDASFWPKGFESGPDGVYATAEPSALGETHVNGKIHRSFSPSFFTDADYSKAVLSKDESTYSFPDGVRGSTANPARVTGVAFCVGTLTNNPAFREMSPVKAKQGIMNMEEEQINAKKGKSPDQADEAAVEHQVKLSTRAFSLSERAINGCYGSDRVKCHMDAAQGHERAEAAHEDMHPHGAKHHARIKEFHINKAAEIADEASDRANQQTKITEAMEGHSASPQWHKEASELHSMAAEAQSQAGNEDKANEHREAMQDHDKEVGAVRSAAEILGGDVVRAAWSPQSRLAAAEARRNKSKTLGAHFESGETVSRNETKLNLVAKDSGQYDPSPGTDSPINKVHKGLLSEGYEYKGYSTKGSGGLAEYHHKFSHPEHGDVHVVSQYNYSRKENLKGAHVSPRTSTKASTTRHQDDDTITANQPRTIAEILAGNGN